VRIALNSPLIVHSGTDLALDSLNSKVEASIRNFNQQYIKEGRKMKKARKIMVQLLITGSIIAMYVLPALAGGGGGA